MRHYLTLSAIALLAACSNSHHEIVPETISLKLSSKIVGLYQPLELSSQFTANWQDPYNSVDVMTDLKIVTPSGKLLRLPGYFHSGKSDELSNWSFKLAPKELGEYTVSSVVYDDGKLIGESQIATFKSIPSASKGFIEANDLWSFKYSNGELFRGIGENFGWEARDEDDSKYFSELHEDKRFNYDYMLRKLSDNGANIFRTWMIYWNLPVDWKTVKNSSRYSNDATRFNDSGVVRMNELVALTEQHGMKMILSLDSHAGFDDIAWQFNTYSQSVGGPANTLIDFFVNTDSKQRYKDKLRFMVANWSYSTGIAAWEFFNEVDNIMYDGYDRKIDDNIVVNWHTEMSDYLSQIDPHEHLITTSISHRAVTGLFDIKNIDFNQSHLYKVTNEIPEIINEFVTTHNKPYFAGEFSAEWDWSKNFNEFKDEMVSDFKRGLWYGLFSPTPIMPLSWWWEYFNENGTDSYFANVQKINEIMLADGPISKVDWPISPENLTEYAVQTTNKVFVYLLNNTDTPITWKNSDNLRLQSIYHCETGQMSSSSNLLLLPSEDYILIYGK
ncbi:hypothetical protein [Thalassotalea agariperforans]